MKLELGHGQSGSMLTLVTPLQSKKSDSGCNYSFFVCNEMKACTTCNIKAKKCTAFLNGLWLNSSIVLEPHCASAIKTQFYFCSVLFCFSFFFFAKYDTMQKGVDKSNYQLNGQFCYSKFIRDYGII